MKKILSILFIVGLLISCDPKPKTEVFIPKPDAMILLRPANGVQLRSTEHYTALEIVQKTMNILFKTHYFDNKYTVEEVPAGRGFSDMQRDFTTPALKMFATDIITQDGVYQREFIYGYDVILTTHDNVDTVAYVPNSVIVEARNRIENALQTENYDEVYRLFNEAFTFIPITGSEWRVLKAQGIN
jgi:hypothetical protein